MIEVRDDHDLVVVMVSTLSRHHVEASLKALSLGAADYIPKPESNRGDTASADFRRHLARVYAARSLGAALARNA